jgi:hypothetical protein
VDCCFSDLTLQKSSLVQKGHNYYLIDSKKSRRYQKGNIKNGQSRETGNIGFFLLLTESVSGCCLTPNKQCVSYTMATTSYNGNMSLGGLVLFDLYFSALTDSVSNKKKPMLPVSLDCPFLIAPSVFPNILFK